MIRNNLFGNNNQSFQQQQFGGQGSNRNRRQPQQAPSPTQFTGSSLNMQLNPQQVNSFAGVSAFSGAASATGLKGHQRVDTFGSSSSAGALRQQPQFGAISASEGPQKNSFKGNPNFQGQNSLTSLQNDLASGQVKFRGDGGAPHTSNSLYMMG